MLKKFLSSLLIICLLLTDLSTAVAVNYTIPDDLKFQYKQEIESVIEQNYPKIIRDINNNVNEAKKLYKKIVSSGYNIEDYINLTSIAEVSIPTTDLELYVQLMKITQEKYLKIKYTPLGTDNTNPIDEYLTPYFRENNVNIEKLSKIVQYQNIQIKKVEKYINNVQTKKYSN